MKKPTKITICGYYGHENLGDEMILEALLLKIKGAVPRANIQILNTKNPLVNTQKMYKSDLFIFGGGSILQNSTSDASLFYYLALINLASLLCKRKIMLANGIGPIIPRKIPCKILRRILAHAINRFDYISVRDTNSQKFLQNLLPNRKIRLVPDPALVEFQKLNQQLMLHRFPCSPDAFFVFCPHKNSLKKRKNRPRNPCKIPFQHRKFLPINSQNRNFQHKRRPPPCPKHQKSTQKRRNNNSTHRHRSCTSSLECKICHLKPLPRIPSCNFTWAPNAFHLYRSKDYRALHRF